MTTEKGANVQSRLSFHVHMPDGLYTMLTDKGHDASQRTHIFFFSLSNLFTFLLFSIFSVKASRH